MKYQLLYNIEMSLFITSGTITASFKTATPDTYTITIKEYILINGEKYGEALGGPYYMTNPMINRNGTGTFNEGQSIEINVQSSIPYMQSVYSYMTIQGLRITDNIYTISSLTDNIIVNIYYNATSF